MTWNEFFSRELASLDSRSMRRHLRALPQTGSRVCLDGREMLNFSSNDYLGLATDPRLTEAAADAVRTFGCGATASRLLAGNLALHEGLEGALADWLGRESALVFGSGFLTNVGVLSSLAGPGDEVYSDWLNHASLIDGIRLSRARRYRYRHKDTDHLKELLRKSRGSGKRLIVTESVFSMDGDIAPLARLGELAGQYDALVIVDEAHALGVFGEHGAGISQDLPPEVRPGMVVGTLSKALGGYGGFVACSAPARDYLVNKARSFLFSTGLPPACLGGALEAVSIVSSEPGPGRALLNKARRFYELLTRHGLRLGGFESQILPIIVGDNEKVVRFSRRLWEKGLLINAIRPPTVPAGTSRVRLSITLTMSDAALEQAATVIAQAARETGVIA